MLSRPSKYLVTQSILSSWLWSYKSDDGYDRFIKDLRREKAPPTKAMLDGRKFENQVNAVCDGAKMDPNNEFYAPIMELAPILTGAQQQVRLSRELIVDGVRFVLYGVLDFLKAGIIYDTKFSRSYSVGKYRTSPQHPMYLFLVPEAYAFQYKICDGKYIYTETYTPDETPPIEGIIKNFMGFLDRQNLVNIYCDNWLSKY